jgi:hypothetical protein
MFLVTLFSLKFNIFFILTKFLFLTENQIRIHFQSWIRISIHLKTGSGSAYSQCGSETLVFPQVIVDYMEKTTVSVPVLVD